MKRKRIAGIICGLLLVLTIIDYRIGIACFGEPFMIPTVVYMVAEEYCSAIDVPYHYMGQRELPVIYIGAKWQWLSYVDIHSMTCVIDNREEFEAEYAAYGLDGSLVEDFDFTENILVLSFNRQVDQICALEQDVLWRDDIPYFAPRFFLRNSLEDNVVYYYEVPRTEVRFEKDDEMKVTKLHLSDPYVGRDDVERVNVFPFFNKWGLAFDRFNHGV